MRGLNGKLSQPREFAEHLLEEAIRRIRVLAGNVLSNLVNIRECAWMERKPG